MKNQKGFSLIELLIVVVIIGIIAAIAIPNLLASRRAANEGSAVSTMRTLHGANSTYFATKGKNKAYPTTATAATDLGDQQLIDASLVKAFPTANGGTAEPKSGYLFTSYTGTAATGTTPATYTLDSEPSSKSGVTATGTRNFKVTESGVIQEKDSTDTAATFAPIG